MAKSHEHFAHDPVPTAISELFTEEGVNSGFHEALLKSPQGINREGKNLTVIDLFRSPNLSDAELLDMVALHTGLSLRTTDAVEQKKIFSMFNRALQKSSGYMVNTLRYHAISNRILTTHIQSVQDIIALLRNTMTFTSDDRGTLVPHAGYCALVLGALGALELEKAATIELQSATQYIYKEFSDVTKNNGHPLFSAFSQTDTETKDIPIVVQGVEGSRSILSMRGKSDESLLTKFLSDPKSTAERALEDGIGFRIEIPEKPHQYGIDIVNAITRYIGSRDDVSDLTLKNTAFFNSGEFSTIQQELGQEGLDFSVSSDRNPKSAESIKQFRIRGTMEVPVGGIVGSATQPRRFEIQIVRKGKSGHNEGLGHHDVYDVLKRVTIMTRFFGACSREWLMSELLRTEPIQKSNNPKEEAEYYVTQLLQDKLVKIPQLKERRVVRYASRDVYERWCVSGHINESLCRAVLGTTEKPVSS